MSATLEATVPASVAAKIKQGLDLLSSERREAAVRAKERDEAELRRKQEAWEELRQYFEQQLPDLAGFAASLEMPTNFHHTHGATFHVELPGCSPIDVWVSRNSHLGSGQAPTIGHYSISIYRITDQHDPELTVEISSTVEEKDLIRALGLAAEYGRQRDELEVKARAMTQERRVQVDQWTVERAKQEEAQAARQAEREAKRQEAQARKTPEQLLGEAIQTYVDQRIAATVVEEE